MASIQLSGLTAAQQALGDASLALKIAPSLALNLAAESVRGRAIDRTTARYNLSKQTLGNFVLVRRASEGKNTASVQLQVKAVPLSEFGARVALRPYSGPDSRGRRYQNRVLPEVDIQIRRDEPRRVLSGGFPLRQRNDGALLSTEQVRRRVGGGRGERSDSTVGNKLTGFRFFTFPKRFTNDELLPDLKQFAGEQLGIELRVAFRKTAKGRTQLRRNTP